MRIVISGYYINSSWYFTPIFADIFLHFCHLVVIHFAIHSLPMVVLLEPQISDMAIFHKCPVCGEFAFIKPELGDKEHKVFECENGHQFKNPIKKDVKVEDKEVWDHMPEWARVLNEIPKNKGIES